MRNATSSFDSFLTGSTSVQQQWMRDHYERVRGYPPFYDRALSWAPNSEYYLDLYAIYTADRTDGMADRDLLTQHPDWVLKDPDGRRLFIPWACAAGTCPQYAADVGNPEWRAWWINLARNFMNRGYGGIHVDDINLEMRVGNGNGNFVRPMDPRTGSPMTDANWRRYMAEFAEEIKAAFPNKDVSHNPIWWMSHSDPSVQRQTDAADIIEMERGFNDRGIGGGSGTYGYRTYLAHVDWLHSRGAAVTFEPYDLDAGSRMFEIASYLLVSNGNDLITSDFQADPTNWWSGWSTDLGNASGARYNWQNLTRRDFAGGMALVNEPDAPSRTVTLPSDRTWTTLSGQVITEVTLGARSGQVLKSSSPTPTEEPTEEPTHAPRITIDSSQSEVRTGRKVIISGTATGHNRVSIEEMRRGRWSRLAQTTARDTTYRARIVLRTRRGATLVRAISADGTISSPLQIEVKRR